MTLVLSYSSTKGDGAVIVEYLDDFAGGPLSIPNSADRFCILTQTGLADGI